MNKKYIVRLNEEERQTLLDMISKGKVAAYKIRHANMHSRQTQTVPTGQTNRSQKPFQQTGTRSGIFGNGLWSLA